MPDLIIMRPIRSSPFSLQMPTVLLLLLFAAPTLAQPTVTTSIRPLQFIAEALLPATATVDSVVGVEDSAHEFTLSPSDRQALDRADLILWIGPEFEVFIADFLQRAEAAGQGMRIDSLPGLELNRWDDGSLDPHLWLDPDNALVIAARLADRLVQMDPDNQALYQANLARFRQVVNNASSHIAAQLQQSPPATYIVYHDAYHYFENHFGLAHGLALLNNPELQPGMREIMSTRKRIAALAPSCLIQEPDANPALVRTLLEGAELQQITLDPLGFDVEAGAQSYPKLLRQVAAGFSQCQ